jgi:hypothetical protein
MAMTIMFKDGTQLYSVSHSVGYEQDNKTDDVMLVQFLLRKISEYAGAYRPLGRPLAVDGVFGPLTHYWLIFFEYYTARQMSLHQGSVISDHALCMIKASGFDYDKSGVMYRLNRVYMMAYGKRDLSSLPEVPGILRRSLKSNVKKMDRTSDPEILSLK